MTDISVMVPEKLWFHCTILESAPPPTVSGDPVVYGSVVLCVTMCTHSMTKRSANSHNQSDHVVVSFSSYSHPQ